MARNVDRPTGIGSRSHVSGVRLKKCDQKSINLTIRPHMAGNVDRPTMYHSVYMGLTHDKSNMVQTSTKYR